MKVDSRISDLFQRSLRPKSSRKKLKWSRTMSSSRLKQCFFYFGCDFAQIWPIQNQNCYEIINFRPPQAKIFNISHFQNDFSFFLMISLRKSSKMLIFFSRRPKKKSSKLKICFFQFKTKKKLGSSKGREGQKRKEGGGKADTGTRINSGGDFTIFLTELDHQARFSYNPPRQCSLQNMKLRSFWKLKNTRPMKSVPGTDRRGVTTRGQEGGRQGSDPC